MNQTLLTFQRFASKELTLPIIELLEENNIPYELEEDRLSFDPSNLSGNSLPVYLLKIPGSEFERVNTLLLKSNSNIEIDEQHYLNSFTDAELIEILLKPDEWSRTDYILAQTLLKERGKEVNDDLLQALRKQRIEDLSQPEKGKFWLIAGYILAILGGVLGVIIGLYMWSSKKTLPNGQRVYHFVKEERRHGFYIFIIGIVCFILWRTLAIIRE